MRERPPCPAVSVSNQLDHHRFIRVSASELREFRIVGLQQLVRIAIGDAD